MREQGFRNEFDEADGSAVHFVGFSGDEPAATCRVCPGEWTIGRIAVRRDFRGRDLGTGIVRAAEDYIREQGGSEARISAQLQAVPFYQKLGYRAEGEVYEDEGCPHIRMRRAL